MPSPTIPQYDIPERASHLAIFDGSYLTDLPAILSAWDSQRILLVASKTLAATTPHIQALETALGARIVARQIGVGAHSPYADVLRIAHALQDTRADCLLCIGSSSYTDASKVGAMLAATLPAGFSAAEVEALVDSNRGVGVLRRAAVKVILVPTSLSAAEWNGAGSCTNAKGKKQHFHGGSMRVGAADLILCDPALAATAPEWLWLSSGARCIDHCIETVCNRACTPEGEADALAGLADMLRGLAEYRRGRHDSSNDADDADRARLLQGVSSAQKGSRRAIRDIIVNRNSAGPSHAIGHQLGSVAGVQHGITSCILLAPTLRYTAESDAPVFARARVCQPKILDVFNETFAWQEKSVSDALVRFFEYLGLPTRLSDVHVTDEAQIDKIAEATLTDIWGGGEAQITSKEEVRKILDMAR